MILFTVDNEILNSFGIFTLRTISLFWNCFTIYRCSFLQTGKPLSARLYLMSLTCYLLTKFIQIVPTAPVSFQYYLLFQPVAVIKSEKGHKCLFYKVSFPVHTFNVFYILLWIKCGFKIWRFTNNCICFYSHCTGSQPFWNLVLNTSCTLTIYLIEVSCFYRITESLVAMRMSPPSTSIWFKSTLKKNGRNS